MSAIAHVSAPRSTSMSGTTRSGSLSRCRRRLPREASSTSPESSASFALAMLQPLPDHEAEADQHRPGEEPRDEPLGDRADVAERPAAAVVRMLRVEDLAYDRVGLRVALVPLRESGHHVRAD